LVSFIKAKELKNGQVLWPLRAILTWVEASPGAFEMLTILWKEESLLRLKNFVN
jgi:glutamyl/glutaminyl-tRNA synthetase